ncbi:hypothetical protein BJY24_003965 [Nocardia transvalensis]|uniref:Uncharacterized protein n=1 Tax=Nocardia transvalensis TaxID=37333 RepID=A0A7W9PGC1_9NOCA|nr:hypothetical protein [Nocardia transvalensis]MBB5915098.1 hypothetical protein [Nocardia transvalensis]
MDMTVSAAGVTAPAAARTTGIRPWLPASILFAATMTWAIGATWDIQWHSDVGPDTFFTLPHLFIYASAAISGCTGLAVILATTSAGRAGRAVDPELGGPGIGVFGRTFTAPLGYLVTCLGAASFLLYGLWDLWWHSLYGFDAVIDSPPHIGLFLSSTATSVGTVIVFAAAREHLWGRLGTLASLGHLIVSSVITALAVKQLSTGTVRWTTAVTALIVVMLLLAGAGFLRWGATVTAACAALLQGVFWWFAPWAAQAYADAVGLPMRENIQIVPSTPALVPLCLVPVGVVVDLALRGNASGWPRPTLAGGLAGLIIALCAPVQTAWIHDTRMPGAVVVVATAIAGAVLGALGGYLGRRFGAMLRLAAPEGAHA